MGTEFAQFIEWNHEKELDWLLMQYPLHQQAHAFFKALNHFYLDNPALWQIDFSWEGFSWISNDDYTQSIIAFRRMDKSGNEIITVCNFVPVERQNYHIGVPVEGTYAEIFSTDAAEFGGAGRTNGDAIKTSQIPWHGYDQSISLTLPPMTVIYLKCKRKKPKRTTVDTTAKPVAKTKKAAASKEKMEPNLPVKSTAKTTGKKSAAKKTTSRINEKYDINYVYRHN